MELSHIQHICHHSALCGDGSQMTMYSTDSEWINPISSFAFGKMDNDQINDMFCCSCLYFLNFFSFFMTQIYPGITVYYNDIPYSIFLLSGLPVQRIISELKKITNPVEEKSVSFVHIFLFESFNMMN